MVQSLREDHNDMRGDEHEDEENIMRQMAFAERRTLTSPIDSPPR